MAIELTTATTQQLSDIRQSLGFPQITDMFPEGDFTFDVGGGLRLSQTLGSDPIFGTVVNFKNCQQLRRINLQGSYLDVSNRLITILNAQDLTNLENIGTSSALNLRLNNLSESVLNQFFTDLPATNKTATIDVANNPGAATCNTSIATNKGYTVVTS